MKLERLLKVPRSARTVQLVINVPESPVQSSTAAVRPKPTYWARIWTFLKVAGPAFVAATALIISVLSLREQSSVDQAAATAGQRQNAERVSFLDNGISSPGSVLIENLSPNPIYNDVLSTAILHVFQHVPNGGPIGIGVAISLGDIPPCSSGIVNLISIETKALQSLFLTWNPSGLRIPTPKIQISGNEIFVQSMSFADSNGLDWQDSSAGGLEQLTSLPKYTQQWRVQAVYTPATGCS